MTIYCFYVFQRSSECIYYREWSRPRHMHSPTEDQKNMFGMLFALKAFCRQLCPEAAVSEETREVISSNAPKYFVTSSYALHYFETATGLRFVMTTSKDFRNLDISGYLKDIYREIYVEYVVKNPLYIPGTYITGDKFVNTLDSFVRKIPVF